ncbi:MAG: hypothetical protein A2Y98_03225 [Candidatus Portnoybacteria bacterium RBG_19FT_COMBO_36_7]|uniref:Prepilin-type N-terminal cleavage/methylation domain-containing protein n=1 Tax=Candidatus Portnoybacteria bacterium RBG_19FT_COMBO_36_7 TaxID=1801992 RepID=A0A1G2F6Q2_9BACT|nr:MAG: hypothetical protein A2Y98_03225 [Candidatus Portnoybacteria bacterium RBG_19FT_COMBO_36_7]
MNNQTNKKVMPYIQKNKSAIKGFTLIEVLVATAIFVTVLMVTVSIFLMAIKNQRRSFEIQNLQDNARFIIERMSKEIRMGEFKDVDVGEGENKNLSIFNQENKPIKYQFHADGNIKRNDESEPGTPQPINSSQVKVTGKFYLVNVDDKQPRVTINMTLTPVTETTNSPKITVQTTITMR